MRITFLPQRRDDTLTLEKAGDQLRINGELLNFNSLNDGDVISAENASSHLHEWLVGPVEKVDGEVRLTIVLPFRVPRLGVQAPPSITVTTDGAIPVPNIDPLEKFADEDA